MGEQPNVPKRLDSHELNSHKHGQTCAHSCPSPSLSNPPLGYTTYTGITLHSMRWAARWVAFYRRCPSVLWSTHREGDVTKRREVPGRDCTCCGNLKNLSKKKKKIHMMSYHAMRSLMQMSKAIWQMPLRAEGMWFLQTLTNDSCDFAVYHWY